MSFIRPEDARVKRDCEHHPGIQARIDLHNLIRDEHLVLCHVCFLAWIESRMADLAGWGTSLDKAILQRMREPLPAELVAEWASALKGEASQS